MWHVLHATNEPIQFNILYINAQIHLQTIKCALQELQGVWVWESIYTALLWASVLIRTPFPLTTLDTLVEPHTQYALHTSSSCTPFLLFSCD